MSQRRRRRQLTLGYAAGAVLLALCTVACQPTSPAANILVVVVDTLRADRLGAYGSNRGLTPHLDVLASRGVVFQRAYSVTSWTNPTVAALFTGEEPRQFQPGASRFIARSQQTLAEVLRERGYRTAAIVANPVLGPELGFADGFETYDGLAGWAQGLESHPKADAQRVTDAALAWIKQHGSAGKPWFLYVHYMDPHWPYAPPLERLRPRWKGDLPNPEAITEINRQIRERAYSPAILALATSLYDSCVASADAEIGRLLDGMEAGGQLAPTVIAITADHGEEFGEHGGVLHARTLFEEVLRVPLLMLLPTAAPQIVEIPVQLTDVGRTLLDAASLRELSFAGKSLLGPRSPQQPLRAQLSPAAKSEHSAAVIAGMHKLIRTRSDQWLLYDLANDPHERRDVAAAQSALLKQLQDLAPSLSGGPPVAADDPALRERLRALGYDF